MNNHNMSVQPKIQRENLNTGARLYDVNCSDDQYLDKCTDDKDAEISLSTSQLRKLRRGRKAKRTGRKRQKARNKCDTLILGNLPLFWNTEAVESLLKLSTGLAKDNCCFYMEMLIQPGHHFAEAVIRFSNADNLFLAYRLLQASPNPITVMIQSRKSPEYRVPTGFQARSSEYFVNAKRIEMKEAVKDKTEGNRNTIDTEISNKPGDSQHVDKPTFGIVFDDELQEESSNIDSTCENTQNKISNECLKDDVRDKCLEELPPSAVIGIKSEPTDAFDEDSNDSTKTILLKQEPIDFDELPTVTPESVAVNDELPIQQQQQQAPIKLVIFKNKSNNMHTVPANIKQEPQDLLMNPVPQNNESVTAISGNEHTVDESEAAIDDILNNFNLTEMKQEIVDTNDNNSRKTDLTKSYEREITAPSENQSSSNLFSEISNKSGGILYESPRDDREEITCETTKSADQTIESKKTMCENDRSNKAPQPSDQIDESKKTMSKNDSPKKAPQYPDQTAESKKSISKNDNLRKVTQPYDQNQTAESEKTMCNNDTSNKNPQSSDRITERKKKRSKKNSSKKALQSSEHTYQVNKSTESVEHIASETATTDSRTRINENMETPHEESDANHCQIVHIKNLPQTTEACLLNIIKSEVLTKMPKYVDDNSGTVLIHILRDQINNKILGEALIKFKTHKEALLACNILNRIYVYCKAIEVQLDIGHKILKEHNMIFQSFSKKRRWRRDNENDDDEPAAKQAKNMESDLLAMRFKRNYLPPVERSADNYGMRPHYLKTLGLKLPLTNAVIVENLHELVDDDKLYEVFSMAGDIKNIRFFKERRKARIEYDHPVEAVQAIQMFRNQKLFDEKIVMRMEPANMPRPLPIGLSGRNPGFEKNGEPLRGVRANIELRNIHELLYELGKMNKFEYNNIGYPFNISYSIRKTNENSKQNSTDNASNIPNKSVSPEDVSASSSSWTNQYPQPSTDVEVIEALGTILKSRGLIPVDTDCQNAMNILVALQSNDHNDPLHRFSNSPNINISPLHNAYIVPSVVPNSSNITQNFARRIPAHAKAPQSFVQGVPNPTIMPNQTIISPTTGNPTSNWEQAPSFPMHAGQNNMNNRSDDRKRRDDYPRDPRLAGKERDSDQSEGNCRVIFNNLPANITQAVFTNKMREVGEVLYCEMAGAGSAIVAFKSFQDADRCYQVYLIGRKSTGKLLR